MIYCCECGKEVDARLTSGEEIYPHRKDLYLLPFWKCDACNNYVGCHHKSTNPTRPLGIIPNQDIRNSRKHIHGLIDPLWKSKKIGRSELYAKLSKKLGRQYHTADIRSIEEARLIYREVGLIISELQNEL